MQRRGTARGAANPSFSKEEASMRTCSAALFSLVFIACLGSAQTIDCGRAPETIQNQSIAKSMWKKYLCTKDNVAVGATIPIEDIPVDLKFSKEDSTCTQEDKNDLNIEYKLQQYLFTNESLRYAECGYRSCELLAHGASDSVMHGYYGVCGAVDSSAGPTVGNMSALRLERTMLTLEVKSGDYGTSKQAFIPVHGSTDADFTYKFSGDARLHATPVTGTIYQSKQNLVPVKVDIPKEVKRGEPKYLDYYLTLGTGASRRILTGYVLVTRAVKTGACSLWMNDKCMKCETPVSWSGFSHPTTVPYACAEMPPKSTVRATFDGTPIVTSTVDNKIFNGWIEMTIQPHGATCSPLSLPCYGQHGVPYPGPMTWTHFHIFAKDTVPDSGISNWDLALRWCQTGDPAKNGVAQCGTQDGSMLTIESLDKSIFEQFDAITKNEAATRHQNLEAHQASLATQ
jgi:hypothetical protein